MFGCIKKNFSGINPTVSLPLRKRSQLLISKLRSTNFVPERVWMLLSKKKILRCGYFDQMSNLSRFWYVWEKWQLHLRLVCVIVPRSVIPQTYLCSSICMVLYAAAIFIEQNSAFSRWSRCGTGLDTIAGRRQRRWCNRRATHNQYVPDPV